MTHIVSLLDASGSMQIMGQEPVQAMNSFIREQKQANVKGSQFSLYTFASDIRKIYDNVDLSTVGEYKDYKPDGMTKLFDCIQQAVTDTRDKNNVVLLIITDGDDTASQKCKSEEAKKLLKEQEEKHNWQIVFLGANQDSFKASTNLGISSNLTKSYSQSKTGDLNTLMRQISAPIADFRKSASATIAPQRLSLNKHANVCAGCGTMFGLVTRNASGEPTCCACARLGEITE